MMKFEFRVVTYVGRLFSTYLCMDFKMEIFSLRDKLFVQGREKNDKCKGYLLKKLVTHSNLSCPWSWHGWGILDPLSS